MVKSDKSFTLGRSLGHDDAILYLLRQSVRVANLSMRQSGYLAKASATRAMVLAESAASIAYRKRHKILRLTKGYKDEIQRARVLAAKASLKAHGVA